VVGKIVEKHNSYLQFCYLSRKYQIKKDLQELNKVKD